MCCGCGQNSWASQACAAATASRTLRVCFSASRTLRVCARPPAGLGDAPLLDASARSVSKRPAAMLCTVPPRRDGPGRPYRREPGHDANIPATRRACAWIEAQLAPLNCAVVACAPRRLQRCAVNQEILPSKPRRLAQQVLVVQKARHRPAWEVCTRGPPGPVRRNLRAGCDLLRHLTRPWLEVRPAHSGQHHRRVVGESSVSISLCTPCWRESRTMPRPCRE